jgi:hypothetical protein
MWTTAADEDCRIAKRTAPEIAALNEALRAKDDGDITRPMQSGPMPSGPMPQWLAQDEPPRRSDP